MKISKTLLNAIAIGITAGAMVSCAKVEIDPTVSDNPNSDDPTHCTITDKEGSENGHGGEGWENCPACGMG